MSRQYDKNTCGPGFKSESDTTTSEVDAQYEQDRGNAAAAEGLMCTPDTAGAMGRVFGRVVGETSPDALAQASFTQFALESYLEGHLKLAEGEWFRDAKVSGAAEAIMEELDQDKDGFVGWGEFQAFRDRMRANLLPGVGAGAGKAEIEEKARSLFIQMQTDGQVDFDKIQSATKEELPAGTEHKKLVAQLGALLVLDIADLDEQAKAVRDRKISESEWLSAVTDIADVGKGGDT